MARRHDDDTRRLRILKRTVNEIRQYKTITRILKAAALMGCSLLGVLYIVAALYKNTGSFTVSLNKMEMSEYGLTLSATRDMAKKTSHLNAQISESITNIAEEWLPANIDTIDGAHNGSDYIAYTFYMQNAGQIPVSYDYSVSISNIEQQLDEAIRIKVYKDGEPTTYAKVKSDGSKQPEPGTKEFYSANLAAKERVDNFYPGEITRFTVVIWIEGNDPDCLDHLIGGEMKIEMMMEIIH